MFRRRSSRVSCAGDQSVRGRRRDGVAQMTPSIPDYSKTFLGKRSGCRSGLSSAVPRREDTINASTCFRERGYPKTFWLIDMKALRFEKYGPPSVLGIQELPSPAMADGDVLVRVKASSINPSDIGAVAGRFHSKLPMTPGRDYAGVVVKGRAWTGKEVWGTGVGFGVERPGAMLNLWLCHRLGYRRNRRATYAR
jgi:hypothetical protein